MKRILAHVGTNDKRTAHAIRGMAANIGAEALRALTGEMEGAARSGDLEAVGARMGALAEKFEELRDVLR